MMFTYMFTGVSFGKTDGLNGDEWHDRLKVDVVRGGDHVLRDLMDICYGLVSVALSPTKTVKGKRGWWTD